MANQKQLGILREGGDIWNEWKKENPLIKIDLREGDLTGAILNGVILSEADLRGADLRKADLRGADFSEANLNGADLCGADLRDTNFTLANLIEAELVDTNFSRADLSGADFLKANLSRAGLIEVNLKGANLTEAILTDAYLASSNLFGANLTKANLTGAYLVETNFTCAYFTETNLKDCVIGRTVFGLTDLGEVKNIESVAFQNACIIDFQTLKNSKNIPKEFLFKFGLPENYIDYLPDFYDENPIRLFPVFLSHAHKDKTFAVKLYKALTKRKVLVWFDQKELKMGDDIRKGIKGGINLYDKFILVCSKNSLKDSWWVDEEINRALKKKEQLFKGLGKHINTIIPITLDDYVFNGWESEMKENIDRFIVGDFKDWKDEVKFEKSVDQLIEALNVDRNDGSVPSFIQ